MSTPREERDVDHAEQEQLEGREAAGDDDHLDDDLDGDDGVPPQGAVFEPSARYEAGRPTRPPVLPARVAPVLKPPEPPAPLLWSATAWKVASLGLGLAVGLVFLDLGGRKRALSDMLTARAGDLGTDDINTATNILLFGTLAAWAVLAIVVQFIARGMKQPLFRPRLVGVVVMAGILLLLAFTAFPLTSDRGLGLAARWSLGLAALAAFAAAVLGMAPGTWAWVRKHRGESAPRRPRAGPPEPPPPPPGH